MSKDLEHKLKFTVFKQTQKIKTFNAQKNSMALLKRNISKAVKMMRFQRGGILPQKWD